MFATDFCYVLYKNYISKRFIFFLKFFNIVFVSFYVNVNLCVCVCLCMTHILYVHVQKCIHLCICPKQIKKIIQNHANQKHQTTHPNNLTNLTPTHKTNIITNNNNYGQNAPNITRSKLKIRKSMN